MKCQRCGAENPDDMVYCGKCGTNLKDDRVSVSREVYGAIELKEGRDWKFLGIGLIVLGLIYLAVLILVVIDSGGQAAEMLLGPIFFFVTGVLSYYYGKHKADKYYLK